MCDSSMENSLWLGKWCQLARKCFIFRSPDILPWHQQNSISKSSGTLSLSHKLSTRKRETEEAGFWYSSLWSMEKGAKGLIYFLSEAKLKVGNFRTFVRLWQNCQARLLLVFAPLSKLKSRSQFRNKRSRADAIIIECNSLTKTANSLTILHPPPPETFQSQLSSSLALSSTFLKLS